MLIGTIKKNSREEIRLTLEDYKGHRVFNARVWYGHDDDMRPGKQGLAYRAELLPAFAEALEAALEAQLDQAAHTPATGDMPLTGQIRGAGRGAAHGQG